MREITDELINSFKENLVLEEKSDATVKKYMHDVEAFSKWLGEKKVDKKLVLDYKNYLVVKYAPKSVNSVISSLNSFFSYSGWYELKVKILKIQKQIFSEKEKELSKVEYRRLLNAADRMKDKRLNLLMQTICSTGIRVSELSAITVESVMKREAVINCKGKMRMVIIPENLCRILEHYIKKKKIQSGPVFVTRSGRPIDRINIWRMMKKLCKLASVDETKVFPHNLRHLFARTYYSVEKDIVRLADILGHSSVNTTRIYTMETGEIHRRQIQSLGLLDFKIT